MNEASAHGGDPAPAAEARQGEGITLYMQPVQDLTVEDRVSRTQYQYSLEDTNAEELSDWSQTTVDKLQHVAATARCRQRSADATDLQADLVIDRDTASRLGITPHAIDNTLYDAFGQRQVSTMFTQLNQYHVVLEADPEFQQNPDVAATHLREIGHRTDRFRCRPFTTSSTSNATAGHQSSGTIPGGHAFVQSCARSFAG